MTADLIRNTFTSINTKTYSCYEDLENAVFPLFGPLQSSFPGLGFRDLIDRLIAAKWIVKTGDQYTIQVPAKQTDPVVRSKQAEEPPPLTFREIYWLVFLNSIGPVRGDWHNLKSLIEKELVEYVDVATKRSYADRIHTLKTAALTALIADEFDNVIDLCSDLQDIPHDEQNIDMVYRLTAKGTQYMAMQPHAKIEY